MSSRKALIDADMLVYRMASVVEDKNPFTGDVLSADSEEAWRLIQMRTDEIVEILYNEFGETITPVMCFSDSVNYRKDVSPTYKANRTKPKPIIYSEMVAKTKRNYEFEQWDNIEADDILGILQDDTSIIVTGDKDLRQIAGYHLHLVRMEEGVDLVDAQDGHRFFLAQCIAGDAVDGYAGCPKFGMKKAKAWLEKYGYTWDSVVRAYEGAMSPKSVTETLQGGQKRSKRLVQHNLGLGEIDALKTAQMAFILNDDKYYNRETGVVTLWQP